MGDIGGAICLSIFGIILLCTGMVGLAIAVQDYVYNDFYDWTVNILGFIIITIVLGASGFSFIGAWVIATEPE
jgi:hypothetical protein